MTNNNNNNNSKKPSSFDALRRLGNQNKQETNRVEKGVKPNTRLVQDERPKRNP